MNQETLFWVAQIVAVLALGMLVVMLIGSLLLAWRLRGRHTDTWLRLGRPLLVFFPGTHLTEPARTFMKQQEYRDLGDRPLLKIVVVTKAARLVAVLSGALVLVIGLLYEALSSGFAAGQ